MARSRRRRELLNNISAYAHQTAVKMMIPGSDQLRYHEEVSLKSLKPILGFGKHNGNVSSPLISTPGGIMKADEVMQVCQYLKFGVNGHPMQHNADPATNNLEAFLDSFMLDIQALRHLEFTTASGAVPAGNVR